MRGAFKKCHKERKRLAVDEVDDDGDEGGSNRQFQRAVLEALGSKKLELVTIDLEAKLIEKNLDTFFPVAAWPSGAAVSACALHCVGGACPAY